MFRECSHQSTEFSKKRQPVAGHPFIVTHHLGLCEFFSVDALRTAVFVRLEHGVFLTLSMMRMMVNCHPGSSGPW